MSADGNTLAVSTPHEDGGATGVNGNQRDESAWDAGAVYVFTRAGGRWTHDAYFKQSTTVRNSAFGGAVALSADGATLVVGASDETSLSRGINGDERSAQNNAVSAGAVYVFGRADGGCARQERGGNQASVCRLHEWRPRYWRAVFCAL
jgi:hypothetical protein